MQAGKLHSIWIILTSFWFMADTCGRAILKSMFGTITRQWCNAELQRWSKRMLTLLGIRCIVVNPHHIEPLPGRATILMCNHASLFDIPLSLQAFPTASLRMLAKKELSHIPIMGGGMVAAEFPFIDRKNRRQAIQDLEKVKNLLESGIVMWIAPEGTRSESGALAPFKKGGFITAIKTNALIIPMGIRGANQILPARTRQFRLNQPAELHIGKPIDASRFDLDHKDALITEVHQAIQDLLR
ncbi:MAG: 1-acyl-sn-glycerol-3-phosphate acyltransferase [Legionellaceae bacterium]|nr:1-acyl-sn-glycerol-3-phosphate acyltransferase [Legionellaceae bacterium]MBP9775232.1 1-acyl-sn-glycerol-3-phosphate acyltransferase [Legionellaceae bacterium]